MASIAGIKDSFREGFEVLKKFLLNIEIGALSLTFMILFLVFIVTVFILLSSPAFLINLYNNQARTLKEAVKNNKNPRDWIGKS